MRRDSVLSVTALKKDLKGGFLSRVSIHPLHSPTHTTSEFRGYFTLKGTHVVEPQGPRKKNIWITTASFSLPLPIRYIHLLLKEKNLCLLTVPLSPFPVLPWRQTGQGKSVFSVSPCDCMPRLQNAHADVFAGKKTSQRDIRHANNIQSSIAEGLRHSHYLLSLAIPRKRYSGDSSSHSKIQDFVSSGTPCPSNFFNVSLYASYESLITKCVPHLFLL